MATMTENKRNAAIIPLVDGTHIEVLNAQESSPNKLSHKGRIEMAALIGTMLGAPIVIGVAGTTLFHTYAAHRALGSERATIEQDKSCAQTVAALGTGRIALKGLAQETSASCRLTTLDDVQSFLNDRYSSSVSIAEATVPAPSSTTVNGWISHDMAQLHADEAGLSHDGVSIGLGVMAGVVGAVGAMYITTAAMRLGDTQLAHE